MALHKSVKMALLAEQLPTLCTLDEAGLVLFTLISMVTYFAHLSLTSASFAR